MTVKFLHRLAYLPVHTVILALYRTVADYVRHKIRNLSYL